MATTLEETLQRLETAFNAKINQEVPTKIPEEPVKAPSLPKVSVSQPSTLPSLPQKPPAQLLATPQGMEWLARAIAQCCALQKAYGKTPAEVETLVDGFAMVLGEYPLEDVQQGFREYLKRNSTIPAPADIVNIIDPPEPKYSTTMYMNLMSKKKKCDYLSMDEKYYIAAFERAELAKLRKEPY